MSESIEELKVNAPGFSPKEMNKTLEFYICIIDFVIIDQIDKILLHKKLIPFKRK